jgi:NAD(P)-dependent dehydrogenase (short-subunit alcohol dehydrogenase family)
MSELAVITGTTHGIGRVTSRELARSGRPLVMLCRDLAAARALREELAQAAPRSPVHVVECDLASLTSVRAAAEAVRRQFGSIGLLINNAGITSTRRRRSADGFELTFATNHLGPFLLTELLRPQLTSSARIVIVASRAHQRAARLDLSSVADPRARYRGIAAYAQSKLANILYSFALARRLAGTSITVNCLHPGVVATNLLPWWIRLVKPLLSPVIFDAERGARTTLYLALSEEVQGVSGKYFDEHQQPVSPAPLANDTELQEHLWNASARWVGLAAPS